MNRKDRTVYIMLTDYPDKVSRTIKRIGLWEYSHMSIARTNTTRNFSASRVSADS